MSQLQWDKNIWDRSDKIVWLTFELIVKDDENLFKVDKKKQKQMRI